MSQVALDVPTCFNKKCPASKELDTVRGTETSTLPDGTPMVSCPVHLHQMAQALLNNVCAICTQKQQ